MKTNKIIFHLHDLENQFANNFSSSIFPILAEKYFQISQFQKAKKVCEIGLKNNPSNWVGQYVLAKILIMNDEYFKAEKLLRKIVKHNPSDIQSLKLFIDVKVLLKRSISSFSTYIEKAYTIYPKNKKIKPLYMQLNIKHKKVEKKKSKTFQKTNEILFNEKIATKTMYNVLVKQKKYNNAMKLLETMKKTKSNKVFIKSEYTKLLNLMKNKRK